MEDSLRYIQTRPSASADPQRALRGAVHDLRLEAERRAWARRPARGALDTVVALLAPLALLAPPPDEAPHDASSDPLVALLAQVRTAITHYVHGLRAEGARPEQMLVHVKAFVRDALRAEGWSDHPDATRVLTAEVVRWSIHAYYDG